VSAALRAAGAGTFFFVVYVPLAALVLRAAGSAAVVREAAIALALPVGRQADLLARSVGLAAAVAVAGTVVGVLAAVALGSWRTGKRRHLRWLVLALVPVPAYVHALVWSSAIFRINRWLSQADLAALPALGEVPAAWVQLMALLPLAVGFALVALESVPPELVEAGRVARSDAAVLGRIVLPLAGPLILAGTGVLFLLTMLDYSVPALFQVNVYALAVFADYSATGQAARALAMTLPVLALTALVVIAAQAQWRRAAQRPVRAGTGLAAPPHWPPLLRIAQAAAAGVLALQMIVPIVSLTAAVGSWRRLADTVAPVRGELAFSLAVAVAAAGLCLPLAMSLAPRLAAHGAAGRLWWAVVALPLAVPAPLVGIGLIHLWNRPGLGAVYGTAWMPVLAAAARFAPLAAIALAAHARRVDPLLVDAARVFQAGPLDGWLRVRLPLLAPGLVAAGGLVFALTLGELGATLLVAPPGRGTLTIRTFNYLHFGASDAVAGLCLVMAAAALAAGALTIGALAAGARLLAEGAEGR